MKINKFTFYFACMLVQNSNLYAQGMPVGEPDLLPDQMGVNLLSGNVMLSDVSVSVGDIEAGGLSYRRWRGAEKGVWWQDSLSSRVFAGYSNNNVHYYNVLLGDGKSYSYNWTYYGNNPPSAPVNGLAAIRDGSALYRDAQIYRHTQSDGTVTLFNNTCRSTSGRELYNGTEFQTANFAKSTTRPNGEKITFTYDTISKSGCWIADRLRSITNNFGYQLHFDYTTEDIKSSDWRQLKSITAINNSIDFCEKTASECSNLTKNWPKLTFSKTISQSPYVEINTVSDSNGQVTTYKMRDLTNNNATSDKELTVNKGSIEVNHIVIRPQSLSSTASSATIDGRSWSYAVSAVPTPPIPRTVTRTDPAGATKTVQGTSSFNLLGKYTDELGRTKQYIYDANNQLRYEINPDGIVDQNGNPVSGYTKYDYDERGNRVKATSVPSAGGGASNIITEAGYELSCSNVKTCNMPIWIKDANGNRTDFTYSADHGGILTQMEPAPTVGAKRPLIINTYAQRWAWVKNSVGALIQSADPVWMISTSTKCETSSVSATPECDVSAPKTVTVYEYGAVGSGESMLLRGIAITSADGTLRTCFQYNYLHRRIGETAPRAGQSSCS